MAKWFSARLFSRMFLRLPERGAREREVEWLLRWAQGLLRVAGLGFEEEDFRFKWSRLFRQVLTLGLFGYVYQMGPLLGARGGSGANLARAVSMFMAGQLVTGKAFWFLMYRHQLHKLQALVRVEDGAGAGDRALGRAGMCVTALVFSAMSYMCTPLLQHLVYPETPMELPDTTIALLGLEPMSVTPRYEISYFVMVCTLVPSVCVNAGYQVLLISLLGHAAARQHAIADGFEALGRKCNASLASLSERAHTLYIKHARALDFVFKVRRAYEGVLGYDLLIVGLALSSLLLQTTQGASVGLTASLGVYFLAQLLLYCILGQEMVGGENAIAVAVYASGWELERGCSRHHASTAFVLRMAQKSHPLRGAALVPLTLSTFATVLRSVYSAYATIKSIMPSNVANAYSESE